MGSAIPYTSPSVGRDDKDIWIPTNFPGHWIQEEPFTFCLEEEVPHLWRAYYVLADPLHSLPQLVQQP